MESGDASDEEPPPPPPPVTPQKDLTRNMWLEAISMLVSMKWKTVSNEVQSWPSPKDSMWHAAPHIDYGNELRAHMPQV